MIFYTKRWVDDKMSEIKLDSRELIVAIVMLKKIQKGTGYNIYPTADFINHSRGDMFDCTNDLYRKLMEIEKILVEIVRKTNSAFINAGIEFENADLKAVRFMEDRVK